VQFPSFDSRRIAAALRSPVKGLRLRRRARNCSRWISCERALDRATRRLRIGYLQSQDRIHRISQARECEIILLMANSTIDQFVDFSLEQKHRLAQFAQADSDTITAADLALRNRLS